MIPADYGGEVTNGLHSHPPAPGSLGYYNT
jgi:hypothetical protein